MINGTISSNFDFFVEHHCWVINHIVDGFFVGQSFHIITIISVIIISYFPTKRPKIFLNIHIDVHIMSCHNLCYVLVTVYLIDGIVVFVSIYFPFPLKISSLFLFRIAKIKSPSHHVILNRHEYVLVGHVPGLSPARCTKNMVSLSPIFVLYGFRIFPLFRMARNQPSSPSVFLEYK